MIILICRFLLHVSFHHCWDERLPHRHFDPCQSYHWHIQQPQIRFSMEKSSIALAEEKTLLIAEANGSDIFRNNAFVACLEFLVSDHSKIVSTTAVLCCKCLHVLLHCKTAHSETLSKSPQKLLQPWLCEPWFRVPEPWLRKNKANKTGHKRSLKRVPTLLKCFKISTIPKRKEKKIVLRSFKHAYYLNQQDRSHALAASTHY